MIDCIFFQIGILCLVLLDTAFVVTEIVMDQKIKNYETYCHGSQSAGCQQGEHDAHHWEHVAHAIHLCSIIVLSIFMVEVRDSIPSMIFENLQLCSRPGLVMDL